MPSGLLANGSFLSETVETLTAEVCEDVEVIGWLYQYYISERKDEVFAGFKKNKKAGVEEIYSDPVVYSSLDRKILGREFFGSSLAVE
ncbi:MAG: hypothetical protein V9G25_09455 [Acidimicrobiia bacterium]